jgi:UDP:flavonoid glycosyltransferase YjiC (YdhE family)
MSGGVGLGPVTQLVGIAEQLALSGFEPVFAADTRLVAEIEKLRFRCYRTTSPSAPWAPEFVDFRFSDVLFSVGVANREFLSAEVSRFIEIVQAEAPALIISALNISASIVSASTGVPLASIAAGADLETLESPLYVSSPYAQTAADEVNLVLESYGQRVVSDVGELSFLRSDARLAPTWPGLDPLLDHVDVQFVTPIRSVSFDVLSGPWPPPELDNMVLCYLNRGSLSAILEETLVLRLCDIFPDKPIVWVAGRSSLDRKNLLVVDKVPLSKWIARSSLLVSGGGYNAMLTAVGLRVPVLACPGRSAERYYYSSVLEGVGLARLGTNVSNPVSIDEMELECLHDWVSKWEMPYAFDSIDMNGAQAAATACLNVALSRK